MKINPISNPNVLQSYQTNKTMPRESAKYLGGADEVSFSQEAMRFSKIMAEVKERIESGAPEQKDRVDRLKAEIKQGTYRVDSDRLAESVLGLPRED